MSVDPRAFAATRWTLVMAARGDTPEARSALSDLCAAYYEPVVCFLRREGRTDDAARDMAHAFFAGILAGGRFDAADPSRGRFRSYLLGALKHFVLHERRKGDAESRGGAAIHVPLTSPTDTRAGFEVPQATDVAPEREFDRQWALTVLQRAMTTLESEFVAVGKGEHFRQLRPWLTGADAMSQTEAAAALGMSVGAIKVAVHRLRQRFREMVKAEIAQTTAGDAAGVKEELAYLISVLG